jgi:hypothetical protein
MLKSGVVAKLAPLNVEKVGFAPNHPQADALGINDIDVHKYWEQIQTDAAAGGNTSVQATGEAQVPASTALPLKSAPSSHYVPRRPRPPGTVPTADEEGEADEYRDDEDPGYRIRDLYEAELLAELSSKMSSKTRTSDADDQQVQQEAQGASGEVADELAVCAAAEGGGKPPSSSEPKVAWEGKAHENPQAVGDHQGQIEEAIVGRSASPRFGEDPRGGIAAVVIKEEKPAEKQHKQRLKKNVKYAASGDPFYPVELEGVIYDSFNLRIAFERDKTGFEESKEFPIRINSVVAARYQILEYLGSAAFSRAA